MADIVKEQDAQRTVRAFISFLSTATGADQSMAAEDGSAVNYPRQYTVIGNDRSVGIEGTSSPLTVGGFAITMPMLMIAAGLALGYYALKG